MTLISRLLREDDGQNLIEYALLAGLIALAAVIAVENSGKELQNLYQRITDKLKGIPGNAPAA